MQVLLSEDSPVYSAHLNNTLGSACKLTEIQNEILDSVLQLFRKKKLFYKLVKVII